MATERSYLEVYTLIYELLKYRFWSILANHRALLDHVKHQKFPHDNLVFPEETVAHNIHNRNSLLKEDGWTEDGEDLNK